MRFVYCRIIYCRYYHRSARLWQPSEGSKWEWGNLFCQFLFDFFGKGGALQVEEVKGGLECDEVRARCKLKEWGVGRREFGL